MRSMTGFGRSDGESERFQISTKIRCVNHRHRDLSLRLPDECRESEAAVRELITTEIERGRVEVSIRILPLIERQAIVEVEHSLVRELHKVARQLAEHGLSSSDIRMADLINMPEALRFRFEPMDWQARDHEVLLATLGVALAQVVESREREGAELGSHLSRRLAELWKLEVELRRLRDAQVSEMHDSLRERISALMEVATFDEGRLEQEVAILVERTDVAEELDRLGAHLQHFEDLLQESRAVGQPLNFLTQEIMRELNTLGSKCRDSGMSRLVIDAKVFCEQVREQIQNIE